LLSDERERLNRARETADMDDLGESRAGRATGRAGVSKIVHLDAVQCLRGDDRFALDAAAREPSWWLVPKGQLLCPVDERVSLG
jgi:hypothetical protein